MPNFTYSDESERFATLLNTVLVGLLSVVTFVALWHFDRSFILGHDESVYATKASEWLFGYPSDQFEIYRPIGMPVLTAILMYFGTSESWLRVLGVIFGALTPAAVFLLFRQMCNIWVALAIAITAATSYLFFEQAPRLLDDVASTALLLFTMALLYHHFKSVGQSKSIYLAAPLAALAFYLRYGVVTSLLVVGIFSYLLLLPKYLQFERQRFLRIGQTVLIGAALLLPHFLYSKIATGEILGILERAGRAAHRIYLGEGLVQYLEYLPKGLGGWVMGLSAIAGVIVLIWLIVTPMRVKYLGLTWVGCIGFVTFFLTGMLVHAEPRYVFLSMILLSGTGIGGVFYLVGRLSRNLADAMLAAFYVVVIFFAMIHYQELTRFYSQEVASPFNNGYRQTLLAIRNDANGSPCAIWTILNKPRASWYSKCEMMRVSDRLKFIEDVSAHPHSALYSIVASNLDSDQIDMATAERWGVQMNEVYRINGLPNVGDLIVYRLSKR